MHDLRDRNVALRLGSAVTAIEVGEAGRPRRGSPTAASSPAEMLLFAAGRVGATDTLNLDAAGIDDR